MAKRKKKEELICDERCQEEKIDELKLLTDKIAELEEKLLRNQAELINFKRRKEEEVSKLLEYSNLELIREILPILDNFERAIKMDDDDLTDEVSRFLEGFKMIYSEFRRILNDFGVTEIEALDQLFDPTYHEAVMTDENKDKESGIVLEVLQKGYKLKDRAIRPAMVKVNK
ncbi:MAG: nucleotide exchange factor GrpE [Bacilli bacterium]